MYELVNGFIVYPWSDEREGNIEYILRCDRELADKMVYMMNVQGDKYLFEFGAKNLKIFSLFSISKLKRFLKSQRQIIYYDAVSRRLWKEHEDLERFEDRIKF